PAGRVPPASGPLTRANDGAVQATAPDSIMPVRRERPIRTSYAPIANPDAARPTSLLSSGVEWAKPMFRYPPVSAAPGAVLSAGHAEAPTTAAASGAFPAPPAIRQR